MIYKQLGNTDIKVPLICLGTMTFGEQNTEQQGFEQMDYALANGVNFFDTAELYSIPPKPETQGSTETIIGNWLKARGNRDKITIASKVCGRSQMNWFRDPKQPCRVTETQIDYAVEHSLKRLQTDYIDIYQIHWPDRLIGNFGSFTYAPNADEYEDFEKILEVMAKHIKKGNIRHVGLSNETPWGVMKFVNAAQKNGLPRVVSIQNAYSLVNRTFEPYLAEVAIEEKVGLLAYSPLAQGFLTGKYLNGARPADARLTLFDRGQRYQTPAAEDMVTKYVALAKKFGVTPAGLALKFCATRPFMTSVIIGATKMVQLEEDLKAFDIDWTEEMENAVNDLHRSCPNPCP